MRTSLAPLVVVALLMFGDRAIAQQIARPARDWYTVNTRHFTVHYPADIRDWALHVAAQLDPASEAIAVKVGYRPAGRVTVIIDDPSNESNGYAMPGPLIFLYPTPPDPRSSIGENRDWGELVAVHEFTHIAHITRPSRSPFNAFLSSILPVRVGPVGLAPRWVLEGYATLLEGQLTGAGRPHGVWRPTILRQLASSGTLPNYAQLSATEGFYAGSMAYLTGSAFLEWLVQREGAASLENVWRRMTARTQRPFTAAFVGVYGAPPTELYGRFTAELTADALEFERNVNASGAHDGELFERFAWYTGDPSLSPDGKQLAIVQRSRLLPPRVLILSTAADSVTDAQREALLRTQRLDPEDVAAVEKSPRPHRRVATLESPAGSAWDSPRFTADGERLLLTRHEPLADGSSRPDLFEWNWKTDRVRRVTHGESIRHPDPSPDGSWAAATRCTGGWCSVVRVDLASGEVTMIASGNLARTFYRPRVAPNGREVVVAMQSDVQWHLVRLDVESGALTRVPTAGSTDSHFDAVFTPDGGSVISVTSAGGIFNLQIINLATGVSRRLTNTSSGVFAPDVTPAGDSIYFLALHARGYNVHRASLLTSASMPPALLSNASTANFAAVISGRTQPARTSASSDTITSLARTARGYGLGPQRLFWAPIGGGDASGAVGGAILSLGDPVGKVSSLLLATLGTQQSWSGVSLASTWRGNRIELGARVFQTQRNVRSSTLGPIDGSEQSYSGVELNLRHNMPMVGAGAALRAGVSFGKSTPLAIGVSSDAVTGSASRVAAFVEPSIRVSHRAGVLQFAHTASTLLEAGSTDRESWERSALSVHSSILSPGPDLLLGGQILFTGSEAPDAERVVLGAGYSPHLNPRHTSNILHMPLLPNAFVGGTRVTQLRAELTGLFPFAVRGDWIFTGSARRESDYLATIGLVLGTTSPRLPQIAAPSVAAELGVGTILVGPFARRATVHATLKVFH